MSKCKGCERRKQFLYRAYWRIVDPIQRFIRTLSGSQRYIRHHKQLLRNIIITGATLENHITNEVKVATKWLENLHVDVKGLQRRTSQLVNDTNRYASKIAAIESKNDDLVKRIETLEEMVAEQTGS